VPGNANGVLAMRLTSFGNEMLKADSQSANIPSPLSSPSLLSLQLRRAERGITIIRPRAERAIITPSGARHYGLSWRRACGQSELITKTLCRESKNRRAAKFSGSTVCLKNAMQRNGNFATGCRRRPVEKLSFLGIAFFKFTFETSQFWGMVVFMSLSA